MAVLKSRKNLRKKNFWARAYALKNKNLTFSQKLIFNSYRSRITQFSFKDSYNLYY